MQKAPRRWKVGGALCLKEPSSVLQPDGGGTPCETGTEGDHEDDVALLGAAGTHGFIQRDGYGGGGGVAVFVNVHKYALRGDAEALCYGVDDAKVCLMRDDEADVLRFDAGAVNEGKGGVLHVCYGVAEDFVSAHGKGVELFLDVLLRGGDGGAAAGHHEKVGKGTIGADVGG